MVWPGRSSSQGHISNTAKDLQLERSHLYKKMRALGINPRAGDEPVSEDEAAE